jgi:sulfhydrogenase subunit beta (sulfur reductase)
MDVIFRESPEDPNYLNRKDKMIIIGIECLEYCDKYASCASMGNHIPRGGYDLMLVDLGEKFILHINSEKGERLIHGVTYIREADEEKMRYRVLREVRTKMRMAKTRLINTTSKTDLQVPITSRASTDGPRKKRMTAGRSR